MKKILTLLLVLILSIQLPAFAENAKSGTKVDDSVERLTYLGMMSSDMHGKLSAVVKREEFAEYMLTFMKQIYVPAVTKSYFYDVDINSEYVEEINRAAELGYIKIDFDKMFYPQNLITFKEAGDAILRAMGYGSMIDNGTNANLVSELYFKLLDGIDATSGNVTVGDLAVMFDNALEEDMVEVDLSSGGTGIKTEKTFLEGYFGIQKGKGRITATPLTSLERDVQCFGEEVAIDGTVYQITDNISDVEEYLGYWAEFYRLNVDGIDTVIYLKPQKTEELVIPASAYDSYSNNTIRYYSDNGAVKNVHFKKGAYVIYNGVLLESYNPSIFDITNGSIELVGNNSGYDVVKIYDYTDIIVGGTTEDAIYVKDSNEHYYLKDYEKVIMRDSYGRDVGYDEISENSVMSVGVSADKSLIIFNIGTKKVSGVLERKISYEEGDIWIVDGREYRMSPGITPPFAEINAKVTLSLNYLGKIAFVETSSSLDWIYGYLAKAYIDENDERVKVKIYTQYGDFEDYVLSAKFKIDEESLSPEKALTALSYASPTDMLPADSVQPQLVKYKRNSAGEITRIDTARRGEGENDKNSLAQNVSKEKRIYMTETGRLFGMFANEKMDCLLTDETIIFTVPGNAEDAKNELTAYSVSNRSALHYQDQLTISSYDTDYEHGAAAKVVCILLDEILKAPETFSFNNLVVITGKLEKWSENQECVVSAVTGYEYFTNSKVTLEGVWEKDVFADVEPGDMIRYGKINNRITGIKKDFDLSNFTYASIHEGEGGANWCGDHIYALYCITPAKLVDIRNGYMYTSYKPTSESTILDCTMMYKTDNMKTFVFEKETGKMYQINNEELREYKYSVNPKADVVIYSSYCVPKMVVVYI